MRQILWFFLIFCSLISTAQVSVSGALFNEWNASLAALTQVTLVNSDIESHDVQLKVQLKASNGRMLLAGETSIIQLAPGVVTLNGISLNVLNAPDGPEISSMKNLGVLPYGSYLYCVKVLQNGLEELDSWCEDIQSDYSEYLNLVYPFDGDSISTHLPVLSWMNSTGKSYCNGDSEYVLRLVKMNKGQSPTEALYNNPLTWSMNCLGAFQVNYPISAIQLEDGQSYAWQVQQTNKGNVVNSTEIWHFVVKTIPERRDLKYVHVQKGENPNYTPVYEKLYIRFDDSYSQGDISYALFSKDGQPLELGLKKEALDGVAVAKGFNTYEIDVTAFSLPKGYYTVVLTNSKLEQFRLKIQVL